MFKKARTLLTAGILSLSLIFSSAALDSLKAGVVTAGVLNLRAEATTQSNILKKLPEATDLSVFDEKDDFYKVSASGTVGYVAKDYVELKDVWNVDNGGGAKVTASALNIRNKPGLEGDVIGKIYEGGVAEIIGINNGWLKVKYKGTTGYISPDYVEFVELTEADKAEAEVSKGQQVVNKAKQYLGVKYVYGGASPSGFDCSGFTSYVYKQFGIKLNRSSSAQTSNGYKVSKSELQLGDLVFFSSPGSKSVGHVGIYIGNGNFIHAVKPGRAVEIDTMTSGYYNTYYWGARRVL
ncbi:MAG: C40 family peptidase [Clostridia bacterium]|nr:C40 family peptidase [Clostridia bacterium]MBQ7087264.1 C40 family peptidase [Clostridia bacterium]MBQ7093312.1 C40 family peptidase [Clostridia bacterium]